MNGHMTVTFITLGACIMPGTGKGNLLGINQKTNNVELNKICNRVCYLDDQTMYLL